MVVQNSHAMVERSSRVHVAENLLVLVKNDIFISTWCDVYKVVLGFESVDEILKCDRSNGSC